MSAPSGGAPRGDPPVAPPGDRSAAPAPRGLARFRGVWAAPQLAPVLVLSLFSRLAYGINALAIVLFVHDRTGSFARAGAVSAAYGAAAGLGLPLLGRLVDRVGQTRVLAVVALLHGCATAALVALGLSGAPTGALAAAGAVAGFTVPPISPCLRGIFADLLDGAETLRAALVLDAIVLELVFIGGPALTALLVAVASPAAALVVGAVVTVGGAWAFAWTPPSRAWRGSGPAGGLAGPLRSPGLRTLLISSVGLGFGLGTLEVALPAFGVEEGSRSWGGVFIAALSAGSAAGGLWYGAVAPPGVRRAYLVLGVVLSAGIALLALPGSALAMVLLAPVAGAALAPLTAAVNELTGEVAPEGTLTEAYAWAITAAVGGLAAGTAAAGVIIDEVGWREAILCGSAAGLMTAGVAYARRATLGTSRGVPDVEGA